MFRKLTAITAAATLAAGALVGLAAPAQAAAKTIYTQCTVDYAGEKLTKKALPTATNITCTDLGDLSALKGATKLKSLYLGGVNKLKITGTSKLSKLGISDLLVLAPVTDPTYAFVKDFPKLTWLHTGPTNVSTLANIAKLKRLATLNISTNKPMSFKTLASNKKLSTLGLALGTSKADLASVAALPNLGNLSLSGTAKQSLNPLKKSKSLNELFVYSMANKKLAKGQTYNVPSAVTTKYGVPFAHANIGWKSKISDPTSSVKSSGTGMTLLAGLRDGSKLGRINLTQGVLIEVYTSGKMDFYRPEVAAKSVRAGELVKAKKSKSNDSAGWNDSISTCSYQWQGDRKNIAGATKLAYKATAADAGKTLRLKTTCHPRAEVKKAYGFKSNTKYSGAVAVGK